MGQEKCHQFLESWNRGPARKEACENEDTDITRSSQDWVKQRQKKAPVEPCLNTSGQGQVCKAASHGCTLAQVVTQEETLFFSWIPAEGLGAITLAGMATGTGALDPQLSSSGKVCSHLSKAMVPTQNTHSFPLRHLTLKFPLNRLSCPFPSCLLPFLSVFPMSHFPLAPLLTSLYSQSPSC